MPATLPRDSRGRLQKADRTPPASRGHAQSECAKAALAACAILLPLGWGIHATFSQRARDAVAAHGWPSTTGLVTESALVRARLSEHWPRADVRYTFQVDGQTYSGGDVNLDVAEWSDEDPQAVLARYRPGTVVEVFYDPARPWEASTLERTELDGWDWMLLGLGRVSRWVGGLCLLVAVQQGWAAERSRGTAAAPRPAR